MRTLFGFAQKEGGKQPRSSWWSVEVSDGGVYFGRLMAGIELCPPRHVRINHPLLLGSAMISFPPCNWEAGGWAASPERVHGFSALPGTHVEE